MVGKAGRIRVAVLMGGLSSERNVSLSTGRQILGSLDPEKYEAIGVDAALLPGSSRNYLPGSDVEVRAVAEARDELARSNALASFKDIASSNGALRRMS